MRELLSDGVGDRRGSRDSGGTSLGLVGLDFLSSLSRAQQEGEGGRELRACADQMRLHFVKPQSVSLPVGDYDEEEERANEEEISPIP